VLLTDFQYLRPSTVDEAVAALAGTRNARVLAGGQTLLNALKLRLVSPDLLVDVSRIDALRRIERHTDGAIEVGAAVTYDEIARSPVVIEHHPQTAAMSSRLVDRQVRARGTIGGNVCLADPTSNFPPLLVALGARLRLRGPDGPRDVDAGRFFVAPYMTALEAGELLEAVILPALRHSDRVAYESLQVGTDSWALARASAWIRTDGERVAAARLVLGCGDVPVRQRAAEAALVDREPSPDSLLAAVALVGEDFHPPSDVHASSQYRRAMAKVVARRAIVAATSKEP
jgi:carbon-monoxide dehydrogenase medium subunit